MRFSTITFTLAMTAIASPVPDEEANLESRNVLHQLQSRGWCLSEDKRCSWKSRPCCPGLRCRDGFCDRFITTQIWPDDG
ncbi:hypothetical protein LZ30DRAFT_722379 [Colletotrichum cereale]|nr:hypothetical protein LZ30DRAFT_722379 [Colletotrichum cereale]